MRASEAARGRAGARVRPCQLGAQCALPRYATSTLQAAFAEAAREYADRPAVLVLPQSGGGARCVLTYAELHARALALARSFPKREQERVSVAAVLFDSSPALLVSYWASLFAGFAFCSLEPSTPEEGLRASLAAVRPSVVLCSASKAQLLASTLCPALVLDAFGVLQQSQSTALDADAHAAAHAVDAVSQGHLSRRLCH